MNISKKLFFFCLIIIILPAKIFSQDLSNTKFLTIKSYSEKIILDSLSIIPNSLKITDAQNNTINDSLFTIDYQNATIFLRDTSLKNIKIKYKTFPFSFSKMYLHKDTSLIVPKFSNYNNSNLYSPDNKDFENFIPNNELDKQGSISRGITFGNNQDLALNSDLNLQLTGKINEELSVAAVISDNNIPIQAEGNTQQIQDFDKIFIKVFNQKNSLTVGDYEIDKPAGYFLNYHKKVKGITYEHKQNATDTSKNFMSGYSQSGLAISKGKYTRMNFDGIEGNQGPYKLYGANNEQFIIILSGSEKVYIDGKLLMRGENNDYTISYNAAEITFTPQQLITKDKRIVVEFEYSERNYTRFLMYNSNYFETKKGKYWLNVYSENDAKNQPILQEFSVEQKILLSEIGDSLNLALSENIDSVAFDEDIILYRKTDTIIDIQIYNNIYVHSTNPSEAYFKLMFSFVGANNGNYRLTESAINGRVFEWIAPENDILQGDYEPVKILITPKKKHVITFGGRNNIFRKTIASYELAFSNNDLNSFSSKHADDNSGYSLKLGLQQYFIGNDSSNNKLSSSVNYMFINRNFDPVEHFRSTEFDRDWNFQENMKITDEHYLNFNTAYQNADIVSISYDLCTIKRSSEFFGINNSLTSKLIYKNFEFIYAGSFLKTEATIDKTTFFRNNISLAKKFRFITIGAKFENEDNKWNNKETDSLQLNSYKFNQFQFFIKTPDSLKIGFHTEYTRRFDYLPVENKLFKNSYSDDYSFGTNMQIFKLSNLAITMTYRQLQIIDTSLTNYTPENTLLGRFLYRIKFFKNAISSSTMYEIGSGLERKKEFSYLEVMPGQGIYHWIDYNENNIKELNEFEIANYQDEADFIRVFRQSNQYTKVYTNQINQVFSIQPRRIWNNETGLKNILSKFSNNLALRIEQKTAEPLFPLTKEILINDTSLTTYSGYFINTFSINKGGIISYDYIYNQQKNKILLTNGIDTKTNFYHANIIYFKLFNTIILSNNFKIGTKTFNSEYFTDKNYEINYTSNKTSVTLQPIPTLELTTFYEYREKKNILGTETNYENKVGLEFQTAVRKKGKIISTINYININYNSDINTSISYIMLESLKPGNNLTWTSSYQHNITNSLQISLIYEGRYSEGVKVIHSGNIQLRAGF